MFYLRSNDIILKKNFQLTKNRYIVEAVTNIIKATVASTFNNSQMLSKFNANWLLIEMMFNEVKQG